MGGLIARYALMAVQTDDPNFPERTFPTRLDIEEIITWGTPHRGSRRAELCNGFSHQCAQLKPDSGFMTTINNPTGRHPTGNSTVDGGLLWSTIGSWDDKSGCEIVEGNYSENPDLTSCTAIDGDEEMMYYSSGIGHSDYDDPAFNAYTQPSITIADQLSAQFLVRTDRKNWSTGGVWRTCAGDVYPPISRLEWQTQGNFETLCGDGVQVSVEIPDYPDLSWGDWSSIYDDFVAQRLSVAGHWRLNDADGLVMENIAKTRAALSTPPSTMSGPSAPSTSVEFADNGVYVGTTTRQVSGLWGPYPEVNKAVAFVSGGKGEVPSNAAIDKASMSVEVFFKLPSDLSQTEAPLVSKWLETALGKSGFRLSAVRIDNVWKLKAEVAGNGQDWSCTAPTAITTTKWQAAHLVLNSSNGSLALFKNGKRSCEILSGVSKGSNSAPLVLGGGERADLDEAVFYGRPLTDAEITTTLNATRGGAEQ